MAGIKISGLPAIASAAFTDVLPTVQTGVTYKVTNTQLATLFGFSSGILALANGGTSASLTANNGGIFYSTASAGAILSGTATAGKVLQSGSTAAPSWSTPTYPSASGTTGKILRSDGTNNVYSTSTFADTYAVSTILYASSANTVTGLATANSSSLVTSLTGVPTWLGPLTNGQIVVGSTGAIPVAATLTAGPGVSISNGAGSITISGTGSGIGWTEVTGTTQAITADNGYVANNAGVVTFTLPAIAAFGTAISIIGKGAGGWAIAQNANQIIQVGSVASTTGVGGSVASTNRFDSIDLICTTANLIWTTLGGPQGILTVV